MDKHLYNSSIGKVRWFVKRFGAAEIVKKPLRTGFAPLIIRSLPAGDFSFEGKRLAYLYHAYNMTWACERCVEVPIAQSYLALVSSPDRVLEIGNVLSHYAPAQHVIVDKYEKGPGVINQDILEFAKRPFDLILSISTFEHIGFDDSSSGSSSKEKILEAVRHVRTLLSPKGLAVITVPIGYNPYVDEILDQNSWQANRALFLKRTAFTRWEQTDLRNALPLKYKTRFPYGNAVGIAEFRPA
jgi:hypothetical protein